MFSIRPRLRTNFLFSSFVLPLHSAFPPDFFRLPFFLFPRRRRRLKQTRSLFAHSLLLLLLRRCAILAVALAFSPNKMSRGGDFLPSERCRVGRLYLIGKRRGVGGDQIRSALSSSDPRLPFFAPFLTRAPLPFLCQYSFARLHLHTPISHFLYQYIMPRSPPLFYLRILCARSESSMCGVVRATAITPFPSYHLPSFSFPPKNESSRGIYQAREFLPFPSFFFVAAFPNQKD